MSDTPQRIPRFNHVAMSMPAAMLDAAHRAAILDFYGEVFGFTEMPTMTADRERLVLRAHSHEQFVFLIASDEPMSCAYMDHFGMSVGTAAELDTMYERAKAYREKDDRVDIVERKVEDHGAVKLHSFYVRYLLPLMIEVQYFDWQQS